jgi:hypothetical protein
VELLLIATVHQASRGSPEVVRQLRVGPAACFVDEYARFRIADGTAVDGELTLARTSPTTAGSTWSGTPPRPRQAQRSIPSPGPAVLPRLAQIHREAVTPSAAQAAAQLVRLFPSWRGVDATMHLVFTTRRGLPPAVRALIDHLAAWIRDEPANLVRAPA